MRYIYKSFLVFVLLSVFSLPGVCYSESFLSWQPSSGEVSGYRIYYGDSQGVYPEMVDVGNVLEYSLSDIGLSDFTDYYFVVKAYNSYGESDPSNEVVWRSGDKTPPLPVQDVAVEVSGEAVTLKWSSNTEPDLYGYRVYYGDSSRNYGPFIPVADSSKIFEDLESGKTWYFAVSSVDSSGNESGLSSEVSCQIEGAGNTVMRINSGGYDVTDGDIDWVEDGYFSNSSKGYVSVDVADTENDAIYQTERYGKDFTYNVPVNNGVYSVNLHFAEIWLGVQADGGIGSRVFDVDIENGQGLLTGYDIIEDVGPAKAVVKSFNNITVEDGYLNIHFISSVEMAKVSAIEILSSTESVDTEKPEIVISSHSTNGSSQLEISGTASDNTGVSRVEWTNPLTGGSGVASGTSEWYIDGVDLAEGENVITVKALDSAGNEASQSFSVNYLLPDTIAPELTITSPSDGTVTNESSASITGTAFDNTGVTGITWTNSLGGEGVANGLDSWTVSNIVLGEGENAITVKAVDAAGNEVVKSFVITYVIPDTIAPALTISSPAGGGTTNVATVNVTGTATDNIEVTEVLWSSSKGGQGTASGVNPWSVNDIVLAEGENTITVKAVDAAGNEVVKSFIITYVIPDTVAPALTISSPAEGFTTNAATVNVTGTATDNIEIAEVLWSNSKGGQGTASGVNPWSVNNIALAEGENVIMIKALDAAGNETHKFVTVNFIPPDTEAPAVTINSPTTASTYVTDQASVSLSGASSDNIGVVNVSWSNSSGGSGTASGTDSWSISGIGLKEGQNVITVKAVDEAGNQATRTLTVTFEVVDTEAPEITIAEPSGGRFVFLRDSSINISGRVSDNVGVKQVRWNNSEGGSGVASGTSDWSVSGIKLARWWNTITVSAVDEAGNTDSVSVTVFCWPR